MEPPVKHEPSESLPRESFSDAAIMSSLVGFRPNSSSKACSQSLSSRFSARTCSAKPSATAAMARVYSPDSESWWKLEAVCGELIAILLWDTLFGQGLLARRDIKNASADPPPYRFIRGFGVPFLSLTQTQ